MSEIPATIVWFRQDLRLADNPALSAAVDRGGPVIPLYIWAPEEEGDWPPGAASRWWLHQSLKALAADLAARGSKLLIRRGASFEALRAVARQVGADEVVWNRRYEPAAVARDADIASRLRQMDIRVEHFNSALLFEPWEIRTQAGLPYQVFTPFWKTCLAAGPRSAPIQAPERLVAPRVWPCSLALDELELEPRIDWAAGLRAAWTPGEQGAAAQFARFVAGTLESYETDRDLPGLSGSSRLSPHLHFGEISPRAVWDVVSRVRGSGSDVFLRELGWREFAHHLLHHFPHTVDRPLRSEFGRFPWIRDETSFQHWTRGRTGYPVVDAAMRELWGSGWMHNRARMIAASVLVKHLLLPWQQGARWFWDTLVDADLANNTLGWQWTAGCGADAAPFFRIFNPTSQGEKFDSGGAYVRRWVPELARLPDRWVHRPWEAPSVVLSAAGVVLDSDYPSPIVDHAAARGRALAAFERIRSTRR